ncbi:hypothetical protein EKPV-NSW-ORF177 [Eastern grey kangaroopox virus]|uniref:Uncharacterized protein n=1 Tax=Eastern grey kangaroopox virus TaxID=2042482 RepID=A0A345Z0S0_9POXV|nr:hypothetical protein EKPV-NSW-ORF177 [Eastern grey kangaroopox virus]
MSASTYCSGSVVLYESISGSIISRLPAIVCYRPQKREETCARLVDVHGQLEDVQVQYLYRIVEAVVSAHIACAISRVSYELSGGYAHRLEVPRVAAHTSGYSHEVPVHGPVYSQARAKSASYAGLSRADESTCYQQVPVSRLCWTTRLRRL